MTAVPLLRVDGLTKVFGEGPTEVHAITGVDLCSDRHEITLVMVPSGSGKTTLLTMLGCLLCPSSGTVAIDGYEVTGLRPREQARVRRTLVGFVFQTFNLLDSLTAQENVEIALNVGGVRGPAAARRAAELLDAARLSRRAGFRAQGLSAGERQRVALARALANAPPLLLADEPTANLDTRNGREVMALLRDLADASPVGAVVVSHDERLTEIADRIVRLEDGRVVERVELARERDSAAGQAA